MRTKAGIIKVIFLVVCIIVLVLVSYIFFPTFLKRYTTTSYPKLSFDNNDISYGFNSYQISNSPSFTGEVKNIKNTGGNIPVLEIDVNSSPSGASYSFHLSGFIAIAEVTSPNQTSLLWKSYTIQNAMNKISPGKFISVRFSHSAKISSISDIVSNEASYNKMIILYEYAN